MAACVVLSGSELERDEDHEMDRWESKVGAQCEDRKEHFRKKTVRDCHDRWVTDFIIKKTNIKAIFK